jgi:hypothetical protein
MTVAQAKKWSTSYLVGMDGLYPVTNWMLSTQSSFALLDLATYPGSLALSDAGWQARIVLRCNIPCPAGSFLNGSACSSCMAGKWSPAASTTCIACTNGPIRGAYTSAGAVTSNCTYYCPWGSYSQSFLSPYIIVGDQGTIRGVDANGMVSTLYKPSTTDQTYAFKFMTLSSNNTGKQMVYLGSYNINKLDLSNRSFTTIAGSLYRGSANGVGTAASFNSIIAAALWQNETFLLCLDSANCNVRQVNLATNVVTTVAGAAAGCSFEDGVGTAAKFRSPTDLVLNMAQDIAYIADAGNYRVRAVSLATMVVSTLIGSGAASNSDGIGTAASIDPRYLALSPDGMVLYVKCVASLRSIAVSTRQITTLVPLLGTSASPIVAGQNGALFFGSSYQVSRVFLSSGQVFPIAGSGVSGTADGVGTAASFLQPTLLAVINESATGARICLTCSVCPAGQMGVCNATASECVLCPLGSYSLAGATTCTPCVPGKYGGAGGMCIACPPGTYSGSASTECSNCSAGTFAKASASACSNCSAGMYSYDGAAACLNCTGLVGNATYTGFGSAGPTSCAFGCRPGFSYAIAAGACSPCGAGQWSPAGTTSCFACTGPPNNATFSGVGASAALCPFTCDGGFLSNGTACIPCRPGTRTNAGRCVPCPSGAWSAAAATGCAACAAGTYATGNASACTVCAIQGQNVVFIGRGTSASCPFYCKAGSFVANRTACVVCTNGTYAAVGATACQACPTGTWSNGGAGSCSPCSSLQITAEVGVGSGDYGLLTAAGWAVSRVACVA